MPEKNIDSNKVNQILDYWFEDRNNPPQTAKERWFMKSAETDEQIRSTFGADVEAASAGELDHWSKEPSSLIALVILLDQFTRNIYRDTPGAFSQDEKALGFSKEAISEGLDQKVAPFEKVFLYLPFMHSEDLEMQKKSVYLYDALRNNVSEEIKDSFENNYVYAVKHYEIVERFGRFPHRNEILGRDTTAEEAEFLSQPGSSF